jgi:hypothetical protein
LIKCGAIEEICAKIGGKFSTSQRTEAVFCTEQLTKQEA